MNMTRAAETRSHAVSPVFMTAGGAGGGRGSRGRRPRGVFHGRGRIIGGQGRHGDTRREDEGGQAEQDRRGSP